MQTVKASVILDDAFRLIGWDVTQLDTREKADARAALSQALQEVWDAWWWNQLMVSEQRTYVAPYATGANYPAGTRVYFPPDRKYYQTLLDLNQSALFFGDVAPATLVGTAYEPNAAYWIECAQTLAGDDYVSGETLAAGDIRRNPDDGLYYGYHGLGVHVSGAGSGVVNGYYVQNGYQEGKPSYGDLVDGVAIFWRSASNRWIIAEMVAGVATNRYLGNAIVDTPDLVPAWVVGGGSSAPAPTVDVIAPAPPDAAFWGLLTAFEPSIAQSQTGQKSLGDVRLVSRQEARTTNNPQELEFEETSAGVRVTPIITADDFSTTATYEATPAPDLVFDS